MYAGQLANMSGPVTVGSALGAAEAALGRGRAGRRRRTAVAAATRAGGALRVPVQAAMNAATPVRAAPLRTARRETSGANRSVMCSSLAGCCDR